MKLPVFLLIATMLVFSSFQQASIKDSITNDLKENNFSSLANRFSSSISLVVNREENIVGKYQAERMLQDYFRNANITKVMTVKENVQSSLNRYLIYDLETKNKKRKLIIKLVDIKSKIYISELIVE